jgi:hypothetical protein
MPASTPMCATAPAPDAHIARPMYQCSSVEGTAAVLALGRTLLWFLLGTRQLPAETSCTLAHMNSHHFSANITLYIYPPPSAA